MNEETKFHAMCEANYEDVVVNDLAWRLLETKIYIYDGKVPRIQIPNKIIDELQMVNLDKVQIAIRKMGRG